MFRHAYEINDFFKDLIHIFMKLLIMTSFTFSGPHATGYLVITRVDDRQVDDDMRMDAVLM